jgi:hypothetical protein
VAVKAWQCGSGKRASLTGFAFSAPHEPLPPPTLTAIGLYRTAPGELDLN